MIRKNIQLSSLIQELKKAASKNEANLWKRLAVDLEKPTRNRRIVNLSKIDRFCKDDEIIIIPGKVLGSGDINKKLTVAAYQFSESAKQKISDAKGNAIEIYELLKKNPKGQKIRIIG